jgi:DHA2 family multidrug resistance protein-like MFS transporter
MTDDTDGLPSPQRQLVTACVILGVILVNLDSAIANIALPTIGRDFAASEAATVWVVNSYHLAVAVCLLPAAAFGEILGVKRVYAFGLIVFMAASLLCAVSPDLDLLVAARVGQGIGGACIGALGPALIRGVYPRRIIGQGFALIALAVALSAVVGPTISALILAVASWPWLFLVNLPVCLVAAPLFLAVAPASPTQKRPFDIVGGVLNAVALGLIVTGVGSLGGSFSRLGMYAIAAGVVVGVVLVRQQRGRKTPLLPLDLLRIPVFALSAGASVCSYAAQITAYISLPFLFQTVLHRSAVATGLLVTPWPLLVSVSAPLAGRLVQRFPPAVLSSAGLSVLALGLVLLVAMPAVPADWDVAWRMAVCGIGFGFFQTPNNTVLMTSGPVARSAAASGLVAMARTIGWSLGSALVALIFAARGSAGTVICLSVGAAFAAVGAVLSVARIRGAGAGRA